MLNKDMKIDDILREGVGRVVPGVNTTADVGPDAITKNAAKLGFYGVSKDGVPPSIWDVEPAGFSKKTKKKKSRS